MGVIQIVRKGLRYYDDLAFFVLTGALAIIASILFLNVIFRYFFYSAFPWAEELTLYLLIWVAGIAARPAFRKGEFIKIDNLQEKLSVTRPKLVFVVKSFILAAIIIYLWVVFISGISLCLRVYRQTSPMLEISMAIPYSAMPYGAFFMILAALEELYEVWIPQKEGSTT